MDGTNVASSSSAVQESSKQSDGSEQGHGGAGAATGEEEANAPELTIEHAKNFLNKVKESLEYEIDSYELLLLTLRDYYYRMLGTAAVKRYAIKALKGHPELLVELNAFLPKRYEITFDEVRGYLSVSQITRIIASNLLAKVQERFGNDSLVCHSFIECLGGIKSKSVAQIVGEVADIFEGHRDLISEFTRVAAFLAPKNPNTLT